MLRVRSNAYSLTSKSIGIGAFADLVIGRFNSGDLVTVFQAGKYEDGIPVSASWEEGDWNGDGDFDSSDLVSAFQTGNYVAAARPLDAAIAPLPQRSTPCCVR